MDIFLWDPGQWDPVRNSVGANVVVGIDVILQKRSKIRAEISLNIDTEGIGSCPINAGVAQSRRKERGHWGHVHKIGVNS